MKTMGTAMAFMTILALPALIFSFYGSRTPEISQDDLGLYLFTLGNVGYDKDSGTYASDSMCTSKSPAITNGTCIHIGSFLELDAYYGANILAASEFAQVCVFLIFVYILDVKRKTLMKENENEETTIRDYSVMVTGLPTDCHPENILAHFHSLYKLDEKDWQNRVRVAGAKPMQNLEHAQQEMYRNTWVADIVVHKKIGKYIRAFKHKGHIMESLHRARAKMKMYAPNTPHASGPNPKLYGNAEDEMMEVGTAIDKMSGTVFEKNFKLLDDYFPTDHDNEHHVHEPKLLEKVDAQVVCAFVTFNYCESAARAVEDYAYYNSFPRNLIFPNELRLRGHVLNVTQPSEPDELVWENLEVGFGERMIHKSYTSLIALVFTIAIFIVVVQAAIFKMALASQIPDLSLCNTYIPEMYSRNHTFTVSGASAVFTRAQDVVPDQASALDNSCAAVIGQVDSSRKVFYAMFTEGEDWTKPVGSYSLDSCYTETAGVYSLQQCPRLGNYTYCPCFDVSSKELCFSKDCTEAEEANGKASSDACVTWTAGQMGSCKCVSELTEMIRELSPSEVLNEISALSGSVCADFFEAYAAASGLTYGISVATVVVNVSLKAILRVFSTWEMHTSIGSEQASYLLKVFIACYFCSTFVALIAYGRIDDLPEIVKASYIFQGPYDDFTADWYSEVGSFLIFSFVLTGFVEISRAYFEYYIVYPLSRWYHFPAVEQQRSHHFPMQKDLNKLLVGPVFEPTMNLGIMIALLFMGMTVAPGIPLFMPLTAILYYLTFRKDKLLVLRFHEKPVHAGDATMKVVISILPWACVIRLCFAIWMLGNEDLLETTEYDVSDAGADNAAGRDTSSFSSTNARDNILQYIPEQNFPLLVTAVTRAMRPNCLPLFCLLIIIICFKILHLFWKVLPIYWLYKFFKIVNHCLCKKKTKIHAVDVDHVEIGNSTEADLQDTSPFITGWDLHNLNHHLRQEQAPFSEPYYSYCYDKDDPPNVRSCPGCGKGPILDSDWLSEQEYKEGWVTRTKFNGRYLVKEKLWNRTTTHSGIIRRKNEPKRTYEIMDENGCSSYELDRVPAYKLAMTALEEGMILAAEDGSHSEEIVNQVKAKNRSILDGYRSQKVASKIEKSEMEDWEVDDDDMNAAYKRVVAKKEAKKSAELNEAIGDSYLSHHDDGEESEDDDDGGADLGGFDFL